MNTKKPIHHEGHEEREGVIAEKFWCFCEAESSVVSANICG